MIFQELILKVQANPNIPRPVRKLASSIQVLMFYTIRRGLRDEWTRRKDLALQCTDNQHIPRAANAGNMENGNIIMHNGLQVLPASYNGEGMRLLLRDTKGVHEPQEERMFHEVLKHVPAGSSMVELGSYWAFYSMWFYNQVDSAKCIMIEPELHHMNFGAENFALNNMQGKFLQGFAGETLRLDTSPPTYTVDYIMKQQKLEKLGVLHADIQGAELGMLHGAKEALEAFAIDFLFISTHSDELHAQCIASLEQHGYMIIGDSSVSESYALDGVIAAQSPKLPFIGKIELDKRQISG